jgi:hypothetical protein
MKEFKGVAIIWLMVFFAMIMLFLTAPNDGANRAGLLVDSVLLLLGIVCLFIYLKEPIKSNKLIFFNFAAFFLFSVVAIAYRFVGFAIFPGDQWFRFYFYQYYQLAHFFLLSFAIVYVVIDSLFNDFRVVWKYVLSLALVGGIFGYYAHPFFENPKYLYSTEDMAHYRAINQSLEKLSAEGVRSPSPEQVAAITEIGVWKDGKLVGTMFSDQKVRRVAELLPYVEGENNYVPLLMKPLHLDIIYMSVMCVVFIFLFFGYQYRNDPPQGAYIEKIIFLFLPYCSLEILHNYAYIKSVEYSGLLDVQEVGWYLSVVNLLLLTLFFGLRLRFITSVKGEFYERELVSDAEHISRWRDSFDNLVVRHFLNPKAIHGRLFAPRTPRNEA